MIIAVTGHRPNKLFGYNMNDPRYMSIKDAIKGYLIAKECKEVYSGMALGVDQLFAIAVLQLKKSGYDIKLHCAIPCLNYPDRWPKESQVLYDRILANADSVEIVTKEPYSAWLLQKRNEYMVDRADEILAFWNGDNGGTKNCIDYAKKNGKRIIIINPKIVF